METQPICNVCRDSNCRTVALLNSEIDAREYRAMKCNTCGLVFAFPIPELSFDSLQNVCGEQYVEEQRQSIANERGNEALRTATSRQMDIVEQYVQKGTALNVGAMGNSIKVLEERGWNLHLVEVSAFAAETARRLWGFNVTVSRIEDFDCPPDTFDFIKLGHVIEHLRDPYLALEKLRGMLRSGGVILIDTDNAHGLKTQIEVGVRKLLGEKIAVYLVKKLMKKNLRKRYGRLTPPEHLYAFSEKSLSKLLDGTGFDVIRVFKPAWGDPTWFPLANQKFGFIEKVFVTVDQIGARFGFGEVLAVLARKR